MEKSDRVMNICMFGLLGAGKSTIANYCIGKGKYPKEVFESGISSESITKSISTAEGYGFLLYDVPGLGDPSISTT